MSSSYSANQYDSAFRSHRLQNWCEAKRFKERPTAQRGHTNFIANDRGHLLPGAVKKGSAWPDFKGTWDLPARIPVRHINPTSRSVEGLNRLKSWGIDPQHTDKSQPHRGSSSTGRLQDAGEQANRDLQQDGAAQSSAAEAQSASQNLPVTGGETTASPNQDTQAALDGSVTQPTEEKHSVQAAGNDRPLSHCSAAKEKPALRSAAGTNSRPDTGKERPSSNVTQKKEERHRDAQQDQ